MLRSSGTQRRFDAFQCWGRRSATQAHARQPSVPQSRSLRAGRVARRPGQQQDKCEAYARECATCGNPRHEGCTVLLLLQYEQLGCHSDALTLGVFGELALLFGFLTLARDFADALGHFFLRALGTLGNFALPFGLFPLTFASNCLFVRAPGLLGSGLPRIDDGGALPLQEIAVLAGQVGKRERMIACGDIPSETSLPERRELLLQPGQLLLSLGALEFAVALKLILALQLSLRLLQREVKGLLAPLCLSRGGEEKAGSNEEIQEPTSHDVLPVNVATRRVICSSCQESCGDRILWRFCRVVAQLLLPQRGTAILVVISGPAQTPLEKFLLSEKER